MLVKQLLGKPEILAQVDNFSDSKDQILRDYCDGRVYKSLSVFAADKKALQIIAYFDEIELCNLFGSSSKKHKLGCLFITLGNLHRSFCTSLKAIFLVAIAPSWVIIQHAIDEFLKPFVEDVKRLSSSGINLRVNGTVRHFCVGLLAFLVFNCAYAWRLQGVHVICFSYLSYVHGN